ncbi:MAG TPA: hypothetical protein VI248_22710 [Kineosporiaceae bacterium]
MTSTSGSGAPRRGTSTKDAPGASRTRPSSLTAVLTTHMMAVAAVTGLAACSSGIPNTGLTPAPGARYRSQQNATAPDPEVLLRRSAATLRAQVKRLREGLQVRVVNQFLDERQGCQLGSMDEWPAQWILDQRVYLTMTDARPAGRSIAERYTAEGWTVQKRLRTRTADQYTFERAGYVISISAASDDGSLNVQTNGPCIDADGMVTGASSS